MKSTELTSRYAEINVNCRCGNTFTTRSVLAKPLKIEVCSYCHPFYSGTPSTVVTGQRIRQFQRKYGL